MYIKAIREQSIEQSDTSTGEPNRQTTLAVH